MLSTTMPLIMMALWTAVAREAPVRPLRHRGFVAYFLATFVVRQLTGAWVAWQINYEVRQGTLAMRLLRPISPLWSYAVENLGALPLRLSSPCRWRCSRCPWWARRPCPSTGGAGRLLLLALVGGWLITFLANVAIGTLALYHREQPEA